MTVVVTSEMKEFEALCIDRTWTGRLIKNPFIITYREEETLVGFIDFGVRK
jgi:hypothetical protein